MRNKTIFIIVLTILLTVFLMMNTDAVEFNFIFMKSEVSKLVVIGAFTFVGFILGYWAAKPKVLVSSYDRESDAHVEDTAPKDHLSAEDRDYIS